MRSIALAALLAGCVVEGDVLVTDESGAAPDADPGADPACAAAPPCPAGARCGRLYDVETSRPLTAADGALPRVALADAPLGDLGALDAVAPDGCGWFALTGAGDLVVAVPTDATFVPVVTRTTGVDAFALRAATDARWADALGARVADAGALLLVFVDTLGPELAPLPGAPVAGVRVTDAPGGDTTIAYFAGVDPASRAAPDPGAAETAASGAALITAADGLVAYGGQSLVCGFGATTALGAAGVLEVAPLVGACAP